jgi:predicted acylesterase/phospholipase RssA
MGVKAARGVIWAAGMLSLAMLQGCAASLLRPLSPDHGDARLDFPLSVRTLNPDHRFVQVPAAAIAARLTRQYPDQPLDILALSGGGAGGAFGAGALVGLTRTSQRPQFAVVTGVSTGALIAPYAFLGAGWDRELTAAYTSGAGAHILRSRGLAALFGSSAFSGAPLQQLVDRYLTDDMLRAVAREARKGRLLLVATTNVDTGEPVVWDLGAIAMRGGRDARTLFRDVLVASASVPGVFPPVRIDNELHVDGGVTMPFFIAPLTAGANVYILIDGNLNEPARATPERATAILSRSVAAGMSRMLRTTLQLTAADADRESAHVDYAAIPLGYPYRSAFDFSAAAARPLFDYASECARTGHLWTTFTHEARAAPLPESTTVAAAADPGVSAGTERSAIAEPNATTERSESDALETGDASPASLPVIDVVAQATVQCPADDTLIERFAVR